MSGGIRVGDMNRMISFKVIFVKVSEARWESQLIRVDEVGMGDICKAYF